MKKIIINLMFGFLLFSNSFAMENSGPKSFWEILSQKTEKYMEAMEAKEAEEFYFDIFKKSQVDRIENILNEKAYLSENSDFLRIEQAIKNNDLQVREKFFRFITQEIFSLIDHNAYLLNPGDIRFNSFNVNPNMSLYHWVASLNISLYNLVVFFYKTDEIYNLFINLNALIYLKKLKLFNPNLKIKIDDLYGLFFISYCESAKFLIDESLWCSDFVSLGIEEGKKVSFFTCKQINEMELNFSKLLHFDFMVKKEEIEDLFLRLNSYMSS